MNLKLVSIVLGIALILAIPSGLWPYSYYILLRWFISVGAIIVAIGFYNSKLAGWSLIFGAITFLFNPIIPVHLDKSNWVAIDLVTAALFFIAAFSSKKKGGTD